MKNNYSVNGKTVSIFLNRKDRPPLESLISLQDFEKADQLKGFWYSKWDEHIQGFYVVGYLNIGVSSKIIYLHRFLVDAQKGKYVDHKNGKTLDNTRENLRICTNSENCYNRKPRINQTSKFKGVYWKRANEKWCARIGVEGKKIELGLFNDEKQAAQAYNKASIKYHGEYARLNLIS